MSRCNYTVNESNDLLGLCAYELYTGKHPWTGRAQGDIARAELPHPCEVNPRLPPALGALVARCLAREPDARYRDGRALYSAVEAAFENANRTQPPGWTSMAPYPEGYRSRLAEAKLRSQHLRVVETPAPAPGPATGKHTPPVPPPAPEKPSRRLLPWLAGGTLVLLAVLALWLVSAKTDPWWSQGNRGDKAKPGACDPAARAMEVEGECEVVRTETVSVSVRYRQVGRAPCQPNTTQFGSTCYVRVEQTPVGLNR